MNEIFTKQDLEDFFKWLNTLDFNKLFNDFIDDLNDKDVYISFKVNSTDASDDFYELKIGNILKISKNELKNDIYDFLINDVKYINEDLTPIIDDENNPYKYDESLIYIEIYLNKREDDFKLLYGTYYAEGFEEKYEII